MSKRQKNVFEKLSIDVKRFEAEDLAKGEAPDHENQISALEMTQFALQKAEKYCEAFERLFEDICMLLKAVSKNVPVFRNTPQTIYHSRD